MAIPNIQDKVSSSDLSRMRDRHNHPENDSFFDDDEDDSSDFLEDDGGIGGSSLGGSNSLSGAGGFGGANTGGFGSPSSFGGSTGGFGSPSGFGAPGGFNNNNPAGQQAQQSDWQDKVLEGVTKFFGQAFKELWSLVKETFATIKLRTVDDWALYSSHNILTAVGFVALGFIVLFIGFAYKKAMFEFWNLPATFIAVGLLIGGTGLIGLGISTLYAIKYRGIIDVPLDGMSNLPTEMPTTQEEYEEKCDELFEDMFDDDEDDFYGDDDEDLFLGSTSDDDIDDLFNNKEQAEPEPEEKEEQGIPKLSESIGTVPVLSREVLMDTLLPLFPHITPDFNKREEVDPDSDEFLTVEALALKALANAANKEEDQIDVSLESLVKSSYSFEMKIKRIRGMNKLDGIEKEMVAYFRSGVGDDSVQCTADIDGDFYKIIVSFGSNSVVGIRDVMQLPEVAKFFRDKSHALPFIVCLDDVGNPIIEDAKTMDTMLIAGKPRSGKSWFVLSIIMSLVAFNSPEQVQFLIIDPKESNLFKEVALLPHVCGLHNDSNVLKVLRELISNEGSRRKKILADNRCENIWDLRKKGVMLPILYVVIDEVMTIQGNLGENFKEFLSLMSTIVTQLPSQGIRLIIVPHRAKGVIAPAIRTNISFTAAIRADTDIIKETLDIPKWTRPLLQPGELAVKISGRPAAKFGRSVAVTSSDFDNSELIRELAKSFYKMGVEIPDMSNLGSGFNRDFEYIKRELALTNDNRVQFDANKIAEADDEIDLDDYADE